MEQCKGCVFHKNGGGGDEGSFKFCHHLLETGKRRKVGENDVCLSYTKRSFTLKKGGEQQQQTD